MKQAVAQQPNFSGLLADLAMMREQREIAVEDAQEAVELAEKRLAEVELESDMREWSCDQRDAWEGAHYAVREAYTNLRKAKEAL